LKHAELPGHPVDGVEPTNNVAERALRPAVLWRKGSFGSESAVGSQCAVSGVLRVESFPL